MTGFQAIAYIGGQAYGELTPTNALLVFAQLFMAGVIVILMDELVQKGWGLGSGVSLFIMTNVAGQVIFNMLDFTQTEGFGPDGYVGADVDNPMATGLPKGIIAALISNVMRAFGIGTAAGPPVDASWFVFREPLAATPSLFALAVTFMIFGSCSLDR